MSDDDAYVYLDGLFIGGNPGVHGTETTVLNVPALTGQHSLEVFYADRAQVAANLGLSAVGINLTSSGTPEPATWALMLVGFGGLGAMLRRRRAASASRPEPFGPPGRPGGTGTVRDTSSPGSSRSQGLSAQEIVVKISLAPEAKLVARPCSMNTWLSLRRSAARQLGA